MQIKKTRNEIKPQPGPQTDFLKSRAHIAIYGGGAGGGKTYALLLEALRHFHNPKFGGVIFRKDTVQIRNEGALWDESVNVYHPLGAHPRESVLEWTFPSGARMKFAHLLYERNIYDWQGAQVPYIGFDELCHFSAKQFWYLLSRNRSASGVPGYLRATCNPDYESWVRKLIDWYIDPVTGIPIAERAGVLRWFIRMNDELHWANSPEELKEKFGADKLPKSLTFIPAKLEDNQILMQKDPSYQANLEALPLIDRLRLKDGNWNARAAAGMFFKPEWFEIVQAIPARLNSVRYWDRAGTEPSSTNPDPDYTVGIKLGRADSGIFYWPDMVRLRATPGKVEEAILNTAKRDGIHTQINLEVDPGQAGLAEKSYYAKLLAGYNVKFRRPTADKKTRAKPASAQSEVGNIKLLAAYWNDDALEELGAFPDGKHDDIVDALSGAFNSFFVEADGDFNDEMVEEKSEVPVSIDPLDEMEW